MKGYDKVDPFTLQAGDVLVVPEDARRLRVSAKTLSRHGLSNGMTSRSDNDERLVNEWFLDTEGPLMMVASDVESRDPERGEVRGVNSLAAMHVKEVESVSVLRLDRDMLPMSENGEYTPGVVKPLVEAVDELYRSYASPEMVTGLDAWPRRGRDRLESCKWTALEMAVDSPFGSGEYELAAAPHGNANGKPVLERDNWEERVLYRLFLAESKYMWSDGYNRGRTLFVRDRAYKFMAAHGLEVWRPRPETWRELARRVLARHAARVLAQCKTLDEGIDKFTRAFRADLAKYGRFRQLWKDTAKKLKGKAI